MDLLLNWTRIFLLIALIPAFVQAGIIVTSRGERIEGELKKTPTGWQVMLADGKVREIPASEVRAIELGTSSGASTPLQRLDSLRRSVEALEDIPTIIERYRRFIEQIKDPAVMQAALNDLRVWQDRLDQGMVKVGKRWMTPQQRRELQIDLLQRIDTARQQIKTRDLVSALKTIESIQSDDPENPSAAYLLGVIFQQQGKWTDSETQFQRVLKSISRHAPSLHNLAVLNARQKQWAGACSMMEQALANEPGIQTLIDAAAELLEMIPEDQKKASWAQKLLKRFTEQDQTLQKVMSDRQMFRWGSRWIDQATRNQLVEAEQKIKQRLDELQGDFDLTRNRIERIDFEISQNEQTLRQIEARSYIRNPDGSYVRVPYPPSYYDIQRDINRLRAERNEMNKRLDSLRDAAKRIQADLPVPRFTGVITPIGEDGVPVILPPGVHLEDLQPAASPATTTTVPTSQPDSPPPPMIKIGPPEEG